jgi:hypothetical protein
MTIYAWNVYVTTMRLNTTQLNCFRRSKLHDNWGKLSDLVEYLKVCLSTGFNQIFSWAKLNHAICRIILGSWRTIRRMERIVGTEKFFFTLATINAVYDIE